jgi:predicted amidohydrolase YtcJ
MRVVELPALHDHHNHVSLYAALDSVLDLAPLGEADALMALKALPEHRLNLAKGWKSERLSFSRDSLAGLPPLIIINFSLHGFLMTPKALPMVEGLWPDFHAHRDDVAWTEAHLPEIFCFYGRVAGLDAHKLAAFMAKLEALGIGSAEDLSTTGEESLEVIANGPFAGRVESWATPASHAGLSAGGRSRIKGFKLFLDGSIGARNAAILPTFLGGEKGLLLHDDEGLETILAGLAPEGKPVAIHAIGQRAIGQALGALDRLRRQAVTFPHVRLEHVQFIDRDQAFRARDLGLCLSMQPNFNSDSTDYADRLPAALLAANNPFRMLIDEAGFRPGHDLILGSDGMPHGLACALQSALFPAFGGQRLDVAELVAGYGGEGGGRGPTTHRYLVDEGTASVRRVDPEDQARIAGPPQGQYT